MCKFQILPISAETPRKTTEVKRRLKSQICKFFCEYYNWNKGKMELSLFEIILCIYSTSVVSIMHELKCNALRFGYRVNFRYEGMLSHSFDRFYVVTKIEIPKVSDLNFTMFQFDYNFSHVVNIEKDIRFKIPSTMKEMFDMYSKNIIPYMHLYKHQVEYYKRMVCEILERDIGMV